MEDKSNILTLDITSKTESVTHVVQSLENFCLDLKIDQKVIDTLLIATDEAITNIVLHAYDGRNDGKIHVSFQKDEKEFIIQFTDFGKSFKPLKIKKKTRLYKVDRLRIGGYGLVLMDTLMDELKFKYDKTNKANTLRMIKYLQ
ncbi:MAG TPA: ATP-binding protein [Spirochaetes bacterium]|nr:ATP-binding protein [Spirochaetota bacterium]